MLNGRTLAVQPCGDVQLKHHSFQLAALTCHALLCTVQKLQSL